MNKTINIDLFDTKSITAAVREVRNYRDWLKRKTEQLAQRLAEYGLTRVELGFVAAIYDGDKDYSVTLEPRGKNTYAIVASGATVLILEFGAGIRHGSGHPQAREFGYGPGTYPGQKHAIDPGYWWYTGSDGKSHYSEGNPPNMPMYQTAKELETQVERIAREVFSR